jgi:hypothetical protein
MDMDEVWSSLFHDSLQFDSRANVKPRSEEVDAVRPDSKFPGFADGIGALLAHERHFVTEPPQIFDECQRQGGSAARPAISDDVQKFHTNFHA